eukprot:TRINITY_DN4416_c0_g1_i1.p1 TRINITY_DN4416_c0_g1~~TRINITY_DN4416_c0_g1_i1.p1  ORF type:complete len:752 (-),score=317.39 TRINITY_DN4416_c0_g1_i1:153-2408(-)
MMMLRTLSPISNLKLSGRSNLLNSTSLSSQKIVIKPRFNSNDAWKSRPDNEFQKKLRNVGISAHIDSGKTTLTERILYYTGKINKIHEVKGKDGVGATMDSMDLEREKGITIQSAATFCTWGDHRINIIDTPGHVDFTIEVERALRVLDGAVLVMCGVSGVQSQTITVDRQMRRYSVPRLVFINKLDRAGGDAFKVLEQLRKKLVLNAALVQIQIGKESNLHGVVDLIRQEAVYFDGNNGEHLRRETIPPELKDLAERTRSDMLDRLSSADDEIAEMMMEEKVPTAEQIESAIRRATLNHKFTPVFLGSALKNTGVQLLLDGIVKYLPNPMETPIEALDVSGQGKEKETKIVLNSDSKAPLAALAFKLEETKFGQLTYMRIYSGTASKGDNIYHVASDKRMRIPRLVRMHANSMEDISEIKAGDICAMYGIDCASGSTFTNGTKVAMSSMHVPEPVLSLAISPKKKDNLTAFGKAISKFQKEDPTFRSHVDPLTGETIISGMGELHLEIYVERMRREYNVDCNVGAPQVAYKETIQRKADYTYTHKKQTGGAGQYAKMMGYIEPIPFEGEKQVVEFGNHLSGNNIPPNYVPAITKGFQEAVEKGPFIGQPLTGVKFVVEDGATHPVDSSELAFRICTVNAFKEAFQDADPVILEPIMKVEISVPTEFQGIVVGGIAKRKGAIDNSDQQGEYTVIRADVPLANMFSYANDLRSVTQGKGEFTMEYNKHEAVTRDVQDKLVAEYEKKRKEDNK